jgi:hypothetical protein
MHKLLDDAKSLSKTGKFDANFGFLAIKYPCDMNI